MNPFLYGFLEWWEEWQARRQLRREQKQHGSCEQLGHGVYWTLGAKQGTVLRRCWRCGIDVEPDDREQAA